jgi:hypothetical protein
VAHADSVNPRFTVGWLEYSQARGFVTDPARVSPPAGQPARRADGAVQYVRNNFFAGEDFTDLADAQAWYAEKAGQRIHTSTCARPAESSKQPRQARRARHAAPVEKLC